MAFMLSVTNMLSVVRLSFVMLNVVAPAKMLAVVLFHPTTTSDKEKLVVLTPGRQFRRQKLLVARQVGRFCRLADSRKKRIVGVVVVVGAPRFS